MKGVAALPDYDAVPAELLDGETGTGGRGDSRALVMVLDDDEMLLQVLQFGLGKEFSVVPLRRGRSFCGFAQGIRPDAIVLDIELPDDNGLRILGALREHPATRDATIVVISGSTGLRSRTGGPGDHFLAKPFTLETLKAALLSGLRRRRASRSRRTPEAA